MANTAAKVRQGVVFLRAVFLLLPRLFPTHKIKLVLYSLHSEHAQTDIEF